MIRKEIQIYIQGDSWLARFVDDANVLNVFGQETIPTAFRAAAPFELVRKTLQELNPDRSVVAR